MQMLLTSPSAILVNGTPSTALANVLIEAKAHNNAVALISNHAEPAWFVDLFDKTGVQFLRQRGRQSGEVVSHNAQRLGLKAHNVIVLAATDTDVHMGKNGNAVLVAAGWSTDKALRGLGIHVEHPGELREVLQLTNAWPGAWWFKGESPLYRVRALVDLSGYGKPTDQRVFASKVTDAAKGGGARLNALLAVAARSLLTDGLGSESDLVWGVYPSSNSSNNDKEVLSDFTHRLRTTVSRVRFAKRDQPLFVRHTPSIKRSAGGAGDRTDPGNQIETLYLNPFYKDKGRLHDQHVVLIDDCTTYGVSFGVASAFLRAAGAARVSCVALGKFGNQLRYYDIKLDGTPFAPVQPRQYSATIDHYNGESNSSAQETLRALIP